jgi:hypothetical protein
MKSQRAAASSRSQAPHAGAAQRAAGGGGRGNAFRQEQMGAASPAQAAVVPEELLYGAFGEEPATKEASGPEAGQEGAAVTTGSERTAGQPIAADEVERLYRAVGASPRGTELLGELDTGGARPTLTWSGQGSYMMGGAVWLDTELEPARLVDVLVHELQHVANERAGRTGDMATQDRATFIERSLEDEASAQTALLVAGLQAGSTGPDVSGFLYGHLMQVEPALVPMLRNRDPGVDWKHVEALAHAFAREQFETTYSTSTTGERYPAYYGGQWDRANGKGVEEGAARAG